MEGPEGTGPFPGMVVIQAANSVDTAVQVFLAVSVWKVGAVLGAMVGGPHRERAGPGVGEAAQRYESYLREGLRLLVVRPGRRGQPKVRGLLAGERPR